jgi:hypothetical protein
MLTKVKLNFIVYTMLLRWSFLQDEWPQRLTSEGPMDIQDEGLLLGSKQDIAELLRDAARILYHVAMYLFYCYNVVMS